MNERKEKKKYLCKSRSILLQVLWSFKTRSWFLGKKEENNWIDRPETANYRHDRINSVLTTFHVHNDREKGAERKKEKDDRLFGKEEKKGKEKDEINQ